MFTILTFLYQQIPDGIIEAALGANPYNTAAYGLLVLVLMVFAFLNYRDRRRSEKELYKYISSTVILLAKVETKMAILQDLRSLLITHITPSESNEL